MSYEEIERIAASYSPQPREALLEFALERRKQQENEVLALAALAAELSMDSIINLGWEPDADPLLLKAVERSGVKIEPSFFEGFSDLPDSVSRGKLNAIKGLYFEVLVEDRLNAGETVGELKLLPGQVASLAASQNQAGWDLKIADENEDIVERIQLKATATMGHIKEALERYPDFRVAVPAEIDGMADEILQTDITNESLEKLTKSQVEELGESGLEDLLEQSAEFAFDMVPVLPAILITVTEGRAVLSGSATLQMSLQRGAKRLGRATAYNALGLGLSAVIGPASIPTVLAVRIAEKRFGHQMAMGDFLRARTEDVKAFTGQPA